MICYSKIFNAAIAATSYSYNNIIEKITIYIVMLSFLAFFIISSIIKIRESKNLKNKTNIIDKLDLKFDKMNENINKIAENINIRNK